MRRSATLSAALTALLLAGAAGAVPIMGPGVTHSPRVSATLGFAAGPVLPAQKSGAPSSFDYGGMGPRIITLIQALDAPPFDPVGVGVQTYTVAELALDPKGMAEFVDAGIFHPGVDGFAWPDGFSQGGHFDDARLAAISFVSVHIVTEPSSRALLARGLMALCAHRSPCLAQEAQRPGMR